MNSIVAATTKFAEIVKRIDNGTLDPDEANRALQDIVEGRFSLPAPPVAPRKKTGNWAMSPSSQINALLRISRVNGWGIAKSDIPPKPKSFVPKTSTEVLLLVDHFEAEHGLSSELVTFSKWSGAFVAPNGYEKWIWPKMQIDEQHIRLVGTVQKPGIRWVAFDPCVNWALAEGRRVVDLWSNPQVVASLSTTEVVMALAYDPSWAVRWNGTEVPYPDLAGWQYSYNGDDVWQNVPYLSRWGGSSQVGLGVDGASYLSRGWSAPSIRELL